MSTEAVTFDFWCTLFRDANSQMRRRARIEAFARLTGVLETAVEDAFAVAWQEFDRCHRERQYTLKPVDAVQIAAQLLEIEVDPQSKRKLSEMIATAILDYPPEPIEGAVEVVKAVADRMPVGIISDTGISPGASLRVILERHGILDLFAVLNFSDEVGVSKPQRPMFQRAADTLGVSPGQMLHVGDIEHTDIAGAQAFGARAALFAGDNPRFFETTRADRKFVRWNQFEDILDSLLTDG